MDSAFLFSFFLLAVFAARTSAQSIPLIIRRGSSLSPTGNSTWLSRSGLFAFGFYPQGAKGYAVGVFLAGIPEKTVVWTANRDYPFFPSNVSLALTSDGRLILQQPQVPDVTIHSIDSESFSSASMLDSGNFVLYDSNGRIIWQSFDNPTNTLLPGQRLRVNQELISSASGTDDSKGIFRMKMQSDGNLVQYPVGTPDTAPYAYYASNTFGTGNNVTLELEGDGHLYLINSSVNILQNVTRGFSRDGKIYLLKLDDDGIARLYSFSLDQGNQSIQWQSTYDMCGPKGLCGLNAYCTTMDGAAECRCPPRFEFLNQGNRSSGCERNFTVESCESSNVSIMPLGGVVWEDDAFSVFMTDTGEGCGKACLEDCNCDAAFYKEGKCRKQRFPLRFGRKEMDSNVALIKVGILKTNDPGNPNIILPVVKKKTRIDVLIIGISLAVFGALIFVVSWIYIRVNRVWPGKEIQLNKNVGFLEDVAPRAFTFAELDNATNGFTDVLGRGAFGTVYKGVLPDSKKVVAVKKLENCSAEGEKEFQNEVRGIGKTHHRNLVRLLGYCLDGMTRLLVYEFMSCGSLADSLFQKEKRLHWDERIRIACDVARGILYLHQDCGTQVIHCDIKPQNILMDENRCAKISDFGLAKLLDHGKTRTFTSLRGTRGYVAPEWHRKSAITVKADVYSFGIVLLEILCCRKAVDRSYPEDEAVLEEWAYDCFQVGELHKLVASDEEVDMRKFQRMIKLALWCIQNDPALRPSMWKILMMLEGTVDIPIPPCPQSFLSAA